MAGKNQSWSRQDSIQCWEALHALWFENIFRDCLIPRGTTKEFLTVETVESVRLSWDGSRGTFGLWAAQEAHSE